MRVVIGTVIIGLMLAALFCLVAPAYAVIFISGGGGGECSTSITDDFSSDLTLWSELGVSGLWTITSGEITAATEGTIIYTDEETCTVQQWVMMKFGEGGYGGAYFRSQNNESTYAYTVRYQASGTLKFAWRYCGGADNSNTAELCQDVVTWNHTLHNNDYYGIEVSGTGNDTVVTVYDLGVSAKQHANWAVSSDSSNQWTTNPAFAADVGKYTGVYHGNSTLLALDDFTAGEWVP